MYVHVYILSILKHINATEKKEQYKKHSCMVNFNSTCCALISFWKCVNLICISAYTDYIGKCPLLVIH